jgi:hypothetical protein
LDEIFHAVAFCHGEKLGVCENIIHLHQKGGKLPVGDLRWNRGTGKEGRERGKEGGRREGRKDDERRGTKRCRDKQKPCASA